MRTKKKLTERQAFALIGQRIEEGAVIQAGLCYEVYRLAYEGLISSYTKLAMYDSINGYMDTADFSSCYAYPRGEEPMARAMAAYWLALDCKAVGQ